MKKFYEAPVGNSECDSIYRELILTDSEATSREVKCLRHPSWALCSFSLTTVPDDEAALQADEAASFMMLLLKSSRLDKPHRYDRVICLRNPQAEDTQRVIEFFRKWIPRLTRECRLFTAVLPTTGDRLSLDVVERAMGAARPVGVWNGDGDWNGRT